MSIDHSTGLARLSPRLHAEGERPVLARTLREKCAGFVN